MGHFFATDDPRWPPYAFFDFHCIPFEIHFKLTYGPQYGERDFINALQRYFSQYGGNKQIQDGRHAKFIIFTKFNISIASNASQEYDMKYFSVSSYQLLYFFSTIICTKYESRGFIYFVQSILLL